MINHKILKLLKLYGFLAKHFHELQSPITSLHGRCTDLSLIDGVTDSEAVGQKMPSLTFEVLKAKAQSCKGA